MKRVFRTTMMALLVMILMVGMMAPAAMAVYSPINITLPVTVTMTASPENGDVPETDEIKVTVTALEGAQELNVNEYTIDCVGNGSTGSGTVNVTFGDYVKPGIHKYGITIGKSSQEEWVMNDSEKYYVVVLSVINDAESETGMAIRVGIHDADATFKYDESITPKPDDLSAEKVYASPMTITVSKRWPDGGNQPVTVYLYEKLDETEEKNGYDVDDAIATVVLNKDNRWTHTFEGLDSRKDYKLDEKDVAGFHEHYNYDDSNDLKWVVTITNYKSLYQTGQLNWPIPVLVCMGSMLMLAGVVMLRKKEEQADE